MKPLAWGVAIAMVSPAAVAGEAQKPDDKDLPSTFSVEYVRAWKRSDGDGPGNVAAVVIEDIATWIEGVKR